MSVPGKLCLGPRCGRDDWTVARQGGREQEKGNGKLLQLMICHWLIWWRSQTGGVLHFNSINVLNELITREVYLKTELFFFRFSLWKKHYSLSHVCGRESHDPSMIMQLNLVLWIIYSRSSRADVTIITTWLKSLINIELLINFSDIIPRI